MVSCFSVSSRAIVALSFLSLPFAFTAGCALLVVRVHPRRSSSYSTNRAWRLASLAVFFFLRARLSVCWDERSWTHEWLTGKGEMPKEELWNRDSPVWSRFYSSPGGIELGAEAEADLQQVWVMEGRRG